MRVNIKSFNVDMQVKNKGIELEVRTPDGKKQLGDLVVTTTGLTWCRGRIPPKNGTKITWQQFIKHIESV